MSLTHQEGCVNDHPEPSAGTSIPGKVCEVPGEQHCSIPPSSPPPAYPGAFLAYGKAFTFESGFHLNPIKGCAHHGFA